MTKKVLDSYFSEEKTAISLFNLDDNRITEMYNNLLNDSFHHYYILISKYLISLNIPINNIYIILKRHFVLFIYKLMYDKLKDNNIYGIDYLSEYILNKKKINIDNLLSNDDCYMEIGERDPFYGIFFSTDQGEYKKYGRSIADLYSKFPSSRKNAKKNPIKSRNTIRECFRVFYDYFGYGNLFADLNKYNKFDLITAHTYFDDNQLSNFSFKLIDYDLAFSYFMCKSVNKNEIKEVSLGHIINIIFKNNNLEFKNDNMNVYPDIYYKIMLNERHGVSLMYSFFEFKSSINKATIHADKITSDFRFIYNDNTYLFTRSGIVKTL